MKKIHIKEGKLKENFNEDLEPMSDYEKRLMQGLDLINSDEYKNAKEITSFDDNSIDSDDEYAKNYIISRLFDAQEIFTDLIDYLENSPYAIEKGGELFKRHLEKVTKINNEIEQFWDEQIFNK